MGAAREGKMEENSLNKYNRGPPPSPPILLPSSEIRYLLCVPQHSPNRERTNLLLRTPSVFFLVSRYPFVDRLSHKRAYFNF